MVDWVLGQTDVLTAAQMGRVNYNVIQAYKVDLLNSNVVVRGSSGPRTGYNGTR